MIIMKIIYFTNHMFQSIITFVLIPTNLMGVIGNEKKIDNFIDGTNNDISRMW